MEWENNFPMERARSDQTSVQNTVWAVELIPSTKLSHNATGKVKPAHLSTVDAGIIPTFIRGFTSFEDEGVRLQFWAGSGSNAPGTADAPKLLGEGREYEHSCSLGSPSCELSFRLAPLVSSPFGYKSTRTNYTFLTSTTV